jgi:hypothetical protein
MMRRSRTRRPLLKLSTQTLIVSEYEECKTFMDWVNLNPALAQFMIKNTNEGQYTPWFVKALIRIGMRPGLPDYHLPLKNDRFMGLWIEMKRKDEQDKKKKAEQDAWIARLNKIGHYATYAYGADEAIRITNQYLNNKIE